ncbi:uncharacterized protein [Zea mays]|uniref:uncharacterized protein isoform X2 n=1 Tax=Zea mays TaxID=4577 RepID=UPI0009AAACEF|nr:uncharacterized protein LOC103649717 isoform X2 [Zea mays]|eukprot:XP_020405690.1 uncharacterized protein LOC103649717 isoform X2 [Zea mays]
MFRPPRPCRIESGEKGMGIGSAESQSQFLLGRVEEEAYHLEGESADSTIRSMRHQVVPLTANDRIPEDVPSGSQFDGTMDSRYYTNLLVNGIEESQATRSDVRIQHGRATAKSSQGRSKNFRDEEDILLVSAWLNVGMDPIQGVDQTHGTLWRRIHEYFNANKKVEARNHSGWSIDDKVANACVMFKAEDPKDKKFSYLHCWKILKDKPKWMDRRKEIGSAKKSATKKQKTTTNSSPASVANAIAVDAPLGGADHDEPSCRPDGKKKEKQKLRQRSSMEVVDYLIAKKKDSDLEKDLKKEERCNKAFALQEERIKLDKEKFAFQRQLEEDRIIGLDLSTMNYKQQQYYEDRQNEILARRFNI